MRARMLMMTASLAVLAGACAKPVAVAPVAPLPGMSAPPAPMPGYDWFFNPDPEEARLAFGLEASDDLRLGLGCRPGSGRLELSANGPAGGPPEIKIEAGGEIQTFRAQSEPSQVSDGDFLIAQVAADAAVFRQFRALGWLAVHQGGRRQAYAPQPGSLGNIDRFFAMCG
jgi:hypothetical protein